MWLRRNLRLDDNRVLDAALRAADAVVPVFVLDDHYLRDDFSPPRLAFLAESLKDLAGALHAKGGRLVVRNGPPGDALAALCRETEADAVFAHADHEPHGKALLEDARRALSAQGTSLFTVEDLLLLPPGELATREGKPFTVYTPFARRWLEADKPAPAAEPRARPGAGRGPLAHVPFDPSREAAGIPREGTAREPEGRRGRGAENLGRVPRVGALPLRGRARPAGPRGHVAPLAAPAFRDDRGPPRSRRGPRRVEGRPAPGEERDRDVREGALLARVLRRHPPRVSARPHGELPAGSSTRSRGSRATRPSGASRRGPTGRTGYSDRGRGHAPAPRRGLDAQPRAHGRRVVPDEGPPRGLAPRRGLLPPAPRGRRSRVERRRLAVGRGLGHGRAAVLPHLQSRPAGPDVRSRRGVRDAVDPRARAAAAARVSPADLHAPWTLASPPADYPAPIVDHAAAKAAALAAFAKIRKGADETRVRAPPGRRPRGAARACRAGGRRARRTRSGSRGRASRRRGSP